MQEETHVCILSLRSLYIPCTVCGAGSCNKEMFVLARFIENVWPLRQWAFDPAWQDWLLMLASVLPAHVSWGWPLLDPACPIRQLSSISNTHKPREAEKSMLRQWHLPATFARECDFLLLPLLKMFPATIADTAQFHPCCCHCQQAADNELPPQ